MSDNGVFISYRRGTGSEVARILQEFLEGQGFDVFLDVDSLGAGHFDEQLLRQIESRRNFVLVCSPGSLDRCATEGDWVRRELAHALKTQRHIVPVTLPQFAWPGGESLPIEIADLQRHNAFEYSHMHWRLIKPRLVEMLRGGPSHLNWTPSTIDESSAASRTIGRALTESAPSPEPLADQIFTSKRAGSTWYEIVEESPDPKIVTDSAGRARMLAIGLPWKVREKRSGIHLILCPHGAIRTGAKKGIVSKPFYIAETQTTQIQLARCFDERLMMNLHAGGSGEIALSWNGCHFQGEENPVDSIDWHDSQRFCEHYGLRLPSELEWEYACRAGSEGAFAGDLRSMGWFSGNSDGKTHAVKQKLPNAWGIFDMHGNVCEWCQDEFQDVMEADNDPRIIRGGCWDNRAERCSSYYRDYLGSRWRSSYVGFRVARDV